MCAKLMKRGKMDSCQNDQGVHQSRRCVREPPSPPYCRPFTHFSFPHADREAQLSLIPYPITLSYPVFFLSFLAVSSPFLNNSFSPSVSYPPSLLPVPLLFIRPPLLCSYSRLFFLAQSSPPLQMSWSYLPDSLASFFAFCLLLAQSL